MGSLQNARKKEKKIDAAGTKFLFVLYSGFYVRGFNSITSHFGNVI